MRPILFTKDDPLWDVFTLENRRLEFHKTVQAPTAHAAILLLRQKFPWMNNVLLRAYKAGPTRTTPSQRQYAEKKAAKTRKPPT